MSFLGFKTKAEIQREAAEAAAAAAHTRWTRELQRLGDVLVEIFASFTPAEVGAARVWIDLRIPAFERGADWHSASGCTLQASALEREYARLGEWASIVFRVVELLPTHRGGTGAETRKSAMQTIRDLVIARSRTDSPEVHRAGAIATRAELAAELEKAKAADGQPPASIESATAMLAGAEGYLARGDYVRELDPYETPEVQEFDARQKAKREALMARHAQARKRDS